MTSILDNLSILETLTQEDRDKLAIFCQERFLQKWDVLFEEWEEWNAMYFLKTGKIDIFKKIAGEKTKIWTAVAEEILWEMTLFQSKDNKRSATGIASENSLLVVILWFSIDELKHKHPDVIEKIKEIIEYRNTQNKKYEI